MTWHAAYMKMVKQTLNRLLKKSAEDGNPGQKVYVV